MKSRSVHLKSQPGTLRIGPIRIKSPNTLLAFTPNAVVAVKAALQERIPHTQLFQDRFHARMQRLTRLRPRPRPRFQHTDR